LGVMDADLQAVIDAWDALPAAIRAGVMALVGAAAGDGTTAPQTPRGGFVK
jgi:hypothetical protein